MDSVVEEACPRAAVRSARRRTEQARGNRAATTRRDLKLIMAEGTSYSVMVGVGESYLPAFVLAMGLGQVASGLITTIPLLGGAVLQLISPAAIRCLGSHRRWAALCAALQAGCFLPLSLAALLGHINVWVMFAVAAVYWGTGLGTASAWSTWVEALVPARIRAPYFSCRTRFNQIATLAGFVLGGVSLQLAAASDTRLLAFGVLFLLAGLCRCLSASCLTAQSDHEEKLYRQRRVGLREFVGRFRNGSDGRLLLYFLSVQAAAQIAGPYFTPYMLGPMKLSYLAYVTLIATSFAAKAAALPALGKLASRYGTHTLLWIGGVGIVPIAGLWLVSNSFGYLLVVQVLAGVTWAAYELAVLLLVFESIRPEERTSVMTTFNLAHAVATAAGSLLGGALLLGLGKFPQTYLLLFALSSVARGLALVGLYRVRPQPVEEVSVLEIDTQISTRVTVRPVPSRAA